MNKHVASPESVQFTAKYGLLIDDLISLIVFFFLFFKTMKIEYKILGR